ncbi:MAG: hypothetical protein HY906_02210 [Deltaproteobacteria bacterium]|nr:hypothetical protein [Deltaproteobacteria bacterium]
MKRSAFVASMAVVALLGCGGGGSTPQQDASTPGTKLVGEACTGNGDCVSLQCLTDDVAKTLLQHDVYTHGGYCIKFPCDPARNDADCGQGAHCFDGTPYGADMWICLKTCDTGSATECGRADYECFEDILGAADGGVARWGCIPVGLIQFDGGVDAAPPEDAGTD